MLFQLPIIRNLENISSKMDSKRLRNTRNRLWKQDSKCFWCGIPTLKFKTKKGRPLSKKDCENPLRATVDHLVSKSHYLRYSRIQSRKEKGYTYNHLVLACNKCNQERSITQSKLNNMRTKILKQGTKPSFCVL